MRRLRVVIADDHPVYREGLAGLIDTEDGLELVGQAMNGAEAIELVVAHEPDLLVLDLEMPELDGMAALREVSARAPRTAVLVLTMYGNDDAVFEAMKAGARGYLVKSADPEQVLGAIRTVADGGVVLSGALGERMSDWFTTLQQEYGPLSQLTPREREVLNLMCRGRDNSAIGATLGISPKTVRNVVSAIFTKLGVAHRADAIAKAREAGSG
jgi:DNA-binding NarL/FixJ family response regulator